MIKEYHFITVFLSLVKENVVLLAQVLLLPSQSYDSSQHVSTLLL